MSDEIDEDPSLVEQQTRAQDPEAQPRRRWSRLGAHKKRLWAAAVLAVAAVVVAVVVTGSGSSQVQPAHADSPIPAQRFDALLAGVPESGDALGSPAAPVTLEFFGDLECPTSREFALDALPSLIDTWARDGKLRIEYRSLETATRQPATFTRQQVAALAAGMQGKLWYYVEDFYGTQGREGSGYVNEAFLRGLAEHTPGLNLARWSRNRTDPPLAAQVAFDEQTAAYRGFRSTPSFLIGRTGSGRMRALSRFSVLAAAAFNEAIEGVLTSATHPRSSQTAAAGHGGRLDAAYHTERQPQAGAGGGC